MVKLKNDLNLTQDQIDSLKKDFEQRRQTLSDEVLEIKNKIDSLKLNSPNEAIWEIVNSTQVVSAGMIASMIRSLTNDVKNQALAIDMYCDMMRATIAMLIGLDSSKNNDDFLTELKKSMMN